MYKWWKQFTLLQSENLKIKLVKLAEMGNASCNLCGIFSWSYEWKFYNLVAWLILYHYHLICFIWKNACLVLLKFPLCWICFKNSQFSHRVNVCCVGRDSVFLLEKWLNSLGLRAAVVVMGTWNSSFQLITDVVSRYSEALYYSAF